MSKKSIPNHVNVVIKQSKTRKSVTLEDYIILKMVHVGTCVMVHRNCRLS